MSLKKILIKIVRAIGGVKSPQAGVNPHKAATHSGFDFVGAFSPAEAKTLLDRFNDSGLNFEIVCDTSGPDDASIDGGYSERSTIGIYVQSDKINKAADIITDFRRSV